MSIIFYIALAALLAAEFFVHRHTDFVWEEYYFFYAIYGFLSSVVLVFVAWLLRFIIKRDENYYD